MTRLAIFDCDGTLVDSLATICHAVEAAFAALRLAPPDRAAIRHIVGLSVPQAMARLAPDADHEALSAAYRHAYRQLREAGAADDPLYPGIRALLDDLRGAGWALGIATGKSARGLDALLDHHGLCGHFVTLQTADSHPSKPHPAMVEAALRDTAVPAEAAVMIGDTGYDMAMGRAAGVRALGVAWGYHDPADLIAAGAAAVAPDAIALDNLIRAAVGP